MNERQSPERQLVRIAHTLKLEGLKPGTEHFEIFVKEITWNYLDGQTIAGALKNGQREQVLKELAIHVNDSFS